MIAKLQQSCATSSGAAHLQEVAPACELENLVLVQVFDGRKTEVHVEVRVVAARGFCLVPGRQRHRPERVTEMHHS